MPTSTLGPRLTAAYSTTTSNSRQDDNKGYGKKMCAGPEESLLQISNPVNFPQVNEISEACQETLAWRQFKQTAASEALLTTKWVVLLNCISAFCKLKPQLKFHDVSARTMGGQNPDFTTQVCKPDIAMLSGDGNPTWKNSEFLGEVKLNESNLGDTKTIGQLGKYMSFQTLANPWKIECYGVLFAGTKACLYKTNPVRCQKSGTIDGLKPVIELVLYLHTVQPCVSCIQPTCPNVSINPHNFNEPTNFVIQWPGKLNSIFVSRSILGRKTTVWQNEDQTITLKSSFLEERLAFQEHKILQKLSRAHVPGILQVMYAGVAGSHEGASPLTFTSETVPRTLYESVLCTKPIQGFKSLTELSVKEFIICLRDALKVIWQAWNKASVLHRDISLGNVRGITIEQLHKNQPSLQFDTPELMFNDDIDDPRGVFLGTIIDWGNASDHDNLTNPIPDGQSGTIPFMSRRMHIAFESRKKSSLSNQDPPPIHTPLDDMEGIIFLLLWTIEMSKPSKPGNFKESTCRHELHDIDRKCAFTSIWFPHPPEPINCRQEDRRFAKITNLSEAWGRQRPVKNKLVDLCYNAVCIIPPLKTVSDLLKTTPLDDPEFHSKITALSRGYFSELVKLLTSFAKQD